MRYYCACSISACWNDIIKNDNIYLINISWRWQHNVLPFSIFIVFIINTSATVFFFPVFFILTDKFLTTNYKTNVFDKIASMCRQFDVCTTVQCTLIHVKCVVFVFPSIFPSALIYDEQKRKANPICNAYYILQT